MTYQTDSLDTLFVNARIVDGTGNPFYYGDVAVADDLIHAVAPPGLLPRAHARTVVECAGLVLAPGFIDIQSHSLIPYLTDGRGVGKVSQGVTTEILGEMWTPAPFGGRRATPFPPSGVDLPLEWHERARTWHGFGDWISVYEHGVSTNIGSFVGGATIREYAKAWETGDADAEELETMRRVLHGAMDDGAFGIAPALIYPPSCFSPDAELGEMARVLAARGGVYIVHLRSEGDQFLEALAQTIQMSRETGCPVEIYHLKASGERNWHKMPRAIEMINDARQEGVDITADMYPYIASGTGLSVLLPDWVSADGLFWDNLRDAPTRRRIHDEMLAYQEQNENFVGDGESRSDQVVPIGMTLPEHRPFVGKTLTEIAHAQNKDWADTAIDLLLTENQRIGTMYFTMSEENLRLQLAQPWIKISTDAGGHDPATMSSPTHPRTFGTYPRVLGKYVRDEKILTLEEAIRKMTSSVANRLHLHGRGQVAETFFADLVLFDSEAIQDNATFADSNRLSSGVAGVWVNGVRVWDGDAHTGERPGRILRGAGRR